MHGRFPTFFFWSGAEFPEVAAKIRPDKHNHACTLGSSVLSTVWFGGSTAQRFESRA